MFACVNFPIERFPAILEELERFSPAIEVVSASSCLLALGKGGSIDRAQLEPLEVGVGPSRIVAQIAASYDQGTVLAGEEKRYLAPLPLSLLPLEPEVLRRLSLLGIRTFADLATLTPAHLAAQFGPLGDRLLLWAEGRDERPFDPLEVEEGLSSEVPLDYPIFEGERLVATLLPSIEGLLVQLRERRKLCTSIRLQLTLEDQEWAHLPLDFASPLDQIDRVKSVLNERVKGLALEAPITGIRIALDGLVAGYARQLSLFPTDEEQQQSATRRLVERITARRRHTSLMRVVWIDPENRLPERRAFLEDWKNAALRKPLCLPIPAQVATDGGLPALVKRRSGWVEVEEVFEMWELDEEWWSDRPVMRRYFRLRLVDGSLVRVFIDQQEGRWYRQQV